MSWFLGGGSSPSKEPSRAAEWSTLLSTDASGRLSLGEPALAKLEAMDEPVALVARRDDRKRGEASARDSSRACSPRADDASPRRAATTRARRARGRALLALVRARAHSDAVDDARHAAAAHKGAHRTLFVDASAVPAAAQNAPGRRAAAATLFASPRRSTLGAPRRCRVDAALLAFTVLEESSCRRQRGRPRRREEPREALRAHAGLAVGARRRRRRRERGDGGESASRPRRQAPRRSSNRAASPTRSRGQPRAHARAVRLPARRRVAVRRGRRARACLRGALAESSRARALGATLREPPPASCLLPALPPSSPPPSRPHSPPCARSSRAPQASPPRHAGRRRRAARARGRGPRGSAAPGRSRPSGARARPVDARARARARAAEHKRLLRARLRALVDAAAARVRARRRRARARRGG